MIDTCIGTARGEGRLKIREISQKTLAGSKDQGAKIRRPLRVAVPGSPENHNKIFHKSMTSGKEIFGQCQKNL